jgi:endonuclease/exonuclease/phosphatase family metal-dependent hydrolase
MKKILLYTVLIIVVSLITFYFWAGSGFSDVDSYYQIETYHDDFANDADTLKIMTYNIGYLSGMTNNLAVERTPDLTYENLHKGYSFLSNQKPDIIGFQEIDFNADRSFNFNQLDSLAIRHNYPNAAKAVNWDKSYVPFPYWPIKYQFGKMLSGQAILSKLQIVSDSVVVLDKPQSAPFYYKKFYLDRLVQVTKITHTLGEFVVMNVHLEAFDKETRESQAEQVLALFKKYEKEYPVFLIGDFNSRPPFATEITEIEKTISIFLEHPGMGEAIDKSRYLENESSFFTFDTGNPYERLDYIFYTKNRITKVASDVAREAGEISDHLPVWMTFTLN